MEDAIKSSLDHLTDKNRKLEDVNMARAFYENGNIENLYGAKITDAELESYKSKYRERFKASFPNEKQL